MTKLYRLAKADINNGLFPIERSIEISKSRGNDMETTVLSYDADEEYLYTHEGEFRDLTIDEIRALKVFTRPQEENDNL